jgi:MFS family permease
VIRRPSEPSRQLIAISCAVVLGLAPWFSATAVGPAMTAEWHLSSASAAWLTMAVQLGFVVGTLVSAVWMLADRWSAQRFAAWSAAAAAASTAAIAWWAHTAIAAIALRIITGAALAGVYPPAMKLVAGWWREHRGLAIGIIVGALSIGSAAPLLLRAVVPVDAWRTLLLIAALSAGAAAFVFGTAVRPGPYHAAAAALDRHALAAVLRNRAVVLATAGYLGHMWELYAMWSWVLTFWIVASAGRGLTSMLPALLAFATIAVGSIGCVLGGWIADRVGRTVLTSAAMAISGLCALAIGPLSRGSLWLLTAVSLIWGVSIVADSAQFSACVTELVPPEYSGTALTVQTSLGFLLTIVSIRSVPLWAERWGWKYAFMPLAIGPVLGIMAMWRLRALPEAQRLAGGAR